MEAETDTNISLYTQKDIGAELGAHFAEIKQTCINTHSNLSLYLP